MNIVIIGSGNVATAMGIKMQQAGHTIRQVYSRREDHAARLASELDCRYTDRWGDIDPGGELYVISLSDKALETIGKDLSLPDKLVVHTAGAVPTEVLLSVSRHCGVLYPLQSLRRESRPFPEIPLLVDAVLPEDRDLLLSFARSISPRVEEAGNEERLKMHVAAVLVNNFPNYLYVLAEDFCRQEGLDFSFLLPIIQETAHRLAHVLPPDAQTGPAVRGDASTVKRHLKILDKYQDISELYSLFSIQIEAFGRKQREGKQGDHK